MTLLLRDIVLDFAAKTARGLNRLVMAQCPQGFETIKPNLQTVDIHGK